MRARRILHPATGSRGDTHPFMTRQATPLTLERDHAETASEAVVRALSTATGVDPTAFPPLYESIETDALDSLFPGNADDAETENRSVRFTHDEHLVVCRDSVVSVFPEATPRTA